MPYTSIELAEQEFLKQHKGDLYKMTAKGQYVNKGVLVTLYWEYGGHHQSEEYSLFFRDGKIFNKLNMAGQVGTYSELN